jgi:hypothetical protein
MTLTDKTIDSKEQIVINTEYMLAYIDKEAGYLVAQFKKFIPSEVLRGHFKTLASTFIAQALDKFLVDARDLQAVSVEDQKWYVQEWYPSLLSTGLKHVATVEPLNPFGAVAKQKITDELLNDSTRTERANFKFFETLDEAKEWLRSQ